MLCFSGEKPMTSSLIGKGIMQINSSLYQSIPAQLAKGGKKFRISGALEKRRTSSTDQEKLFDLIDSKTVLISHNVTDPLVSLTQTKDLESYKMYLADTGLFVTLLLIDRPAAENDIYRKLLSDKLPANLGYLYENMVAQVIAATGRDLFYHTWEKPNSTHYYEVDFLFSASTKVSALEVKSSGTGKHDSLSEFVRKYRSAVGRTIVLSQKDIKTENHLHFYPIYMTPFVI